MLIEKPVTITPKWVCIKLLGLACPGSQLRLLPQALRGATSVCPLTAIIILFLLSRFQMEERNCAEQEAWSRQNQWARDTLAYHSTLLPTSPF